MGPQTACDPTVGTRGFLRSAFKHAQIPICALSCDISVSHACLTYEIPSTYHDISSAITFGYASIEPALTVAVVFTQLYHFNPRH